MLKGEYYAGSSVEAVPVTMWGEATSDPCTKWD